MYIKEIGGKAGLEIIFSNRKGMILYEIPSLYRYT